MQILLSEKLNKKSVNVNKTLNVKVSGNKKILPETSIDGVINAYDLYNEERELSNKFRLVFDINPYCTNVLFNPITEVVKDEGSDNVVCLNFTPKTASEINGVYGKDGRLTYDEYEAVRDTQLTNERCGYTYHCGLDIFNNHILRGDTFKTVNMYRGSSPDFNTIDDSYRTVDGQLVNDDTQWATMYDNLNTLMFAESYANNMNEENGWFGFLNEAKLPSYIVDTDNLRIGNLLINKVINSKNACDFIDMYPGRELFSFTPLLNKHRKRYEQNWNYCITYPSRSETENYPFLRNMGDRCNLKALMIDESIVNDNGLNVLTVYSVTMHGLQEGDLVNIYVGDDLKYESVEVLSVPDKYVFQVAKTEGNISFKWLNVSSDTLTYNIKNENNEDETYIYDVNDGIVRNSENGKIYYVSVADMCNIDDNAQDISFCEVLSNVESHYYVRMFSRVPNFKFSDTEVNDLTVNGNDSDLIERYSNPSDPKCEFENHIGKLGFAQTAYGDEVTELVYTDDVNVSYLKDNLGRPLSEIYLTFVKNNAGYKEWYGIGKNRDISSEKVEFSHCFGPITCGFLLSPYISKKSADYIGIRDMRNEDGEEINFLTDREFVGDLSVFNPVLCEEKHIQNAVHRFNTVQREMRPNGFSEFFYDDFNPSNNFDSDTYISPYGRFVGDFSKYSSDDYVVNGGSRSGSGNGRRFGNLSGSNDNDNNGQETSQGRGITLRSSTRSKKYRMPSDSGETLYYPEGYYYQPSYVIPIKEFGDEIMSRQPDIFEIYSISEGINSWLDVPTYLFCTESANYFFKGDKAYIYNIERNKCYTLVVTDVHTSNKFSAILCDEKGRYVRSGFGYEETEDGNNIMSFRLFKRPSDIPLYAKVIMDGSCRFYWRNLQIIDDYPFTNGAFYIKRDINFYLRRQDPHGENLSINFIGPDYTPIGESTNYYPSTNIENYAEEIEEC